MSIRIERITLEHVSGFVTALDTVARERRYLLFVEAPPRERVEAFVRANLENDIAQYVALDGDTLVGWCDICPSTFHGTSHCGTVGMGLLPNYRGLGIGRKLLQTCIDHSVERGITRIELEAFSTNWRAIRLYESLGFQHEGIKRKLRCVDGSWSDGVIMAIVKN